MRVRLLRYIICSMIFSLFIVHASSDLWIEKNIDTGVAKYGDTVSYTILFGNSGAGPVTDAVIIDRLPTGLNIMSSAWQVGAGGWIYNYNAATGNVVSYEYIYNSGDVVSTSYRRDIGSISIGETGALVITAAIDQSFAPQPYGVSGIVYNFDGINHYADYGTAATIDRGTSDFTVSIWIYKLSGTTALNNGDNSFVAGQWYGGGDTPGQNERALFMGNGVDQDNASFRVEVNGEIKSAADGGGGGSLSLNQRYHLVGMRDGTDIKLYINGTLAATTDIGTGALNDRDQTELFVALQAGGPTTHISQLRAYDFRIFSGAKTTDDIATIMSGGVIRTGLVQRYKMDEGTGTVSYDSVNGGTGFLDHVAVSDPFYYPTDRPSFHGALGYYRPGGSGGVFFPRWEVTDNYCLDVFGRWLDFAAGICNYTEIYSSDPDINTTNNSGARYLIYTPTADVYITQSVTGDYVSGNFVTFTITYGNSGVDAVTGLEVTSTLSDGLSGTSSNPGWNSINGGTYTRDIGDMAVGSTGMIVFTAQIVTGADNAYLYHRASVDSELTDLYTSNNANNRSVYANPPDQSDLYIAKTASPSSVKRNEYVTYTITYGNSGNIAQSGVYITDTLPVGVTYISSQINTGNGFTGFTVITGVDSSGQQTITWSGLSVSVDGTGTIVFTAQVVQTFLSADPTTYSGFVAYWKANHMSGLSDGDPVHAWPSVGEQYYYFDGVDDKINFDSPVQIFVNNGDYVEFGLRGLVVPTGSPPILGTLGSSNDFIYISDAQVHTRLYLTPFIRRQTNITFPTGKTVADLIRVRYTRVSNTSVQVNYEYNDGEEYTTFMSPVGSPDFTVDTFFFEDIMAGNSTYVEGVLKYLDVNGTVYNYENNWGGSGTVYGNPKLQTTLYSPDNVYVATYRGMSAWFGTGGGTTNPQSRTFADGGTKVYASANQTVYQYSLSSAYDIATISYVQNFDFESISVNQDDGVNIQLSDDGSKLYFLNSNVDRLFEYDLSTPWDISTASYSSVAFDFSSFDNIPVRFYIGDNGTKLYYYGQQKDTVFQFTLGTAWDLSTLSSANKSYNFSAVATNPRGLSFNADGTKMVIGSSPNAVTEYVYQFNLGTAWDVSTAKYDDSFGGDLSVYAQEETPTGVYFKHTDDDYLYVGGRGNDGIFEYIADRPVYKTSIKNGLPAIELSGSLTDVLYAPATFGLGEQHTIVYLVEPFATDTSQYIGVSGTGQGDYSFWATDDAVASFYMKPTNGDNFYQRQPNYTWGDMMFVTFRRSGSVVDLFNHYTQVPSSVAGVLNSGTSWLGLGTVASSGAEDLSFEGYVYEALLYQDDLSDADILALQDMLYGKYYLSGSTPTSIGNTVVIGCDCTELDTGNNTALAQTDYTLQSDVYVDKTTTDTNVRKGDYITYTITVGNSGEAMATDIVITDILLTGLAYSTSSIVRPNNNTVSVPIQTLLASGTQLVRSGLYLRPGLTGTIVLTAQILTNFVTTDIVSSFPGLTGHWDAAAITGLASGYFIDTRPDSSTNGNDLSAPTVEITNSKPIDKYSLQGGGRPNDGKFADSGSKRYLYRSQTLYQYNLSTPYDLDTRSYIRNFDLTPLSLPSNIKAFDFADSGNKIYLVGSNDDSIYEVDLSTPYDISTISYSGVNISAVDLSPQSIQVRSSTKFYLMGVQRGLYEFTMSTPRDLSTATASSPTTVPASFSLMANFNIYNSGGNLLMIEQDTHNVHLYEFTTPRDITTVSNLNESFALQIGGSRSYYVEYIDSTDQLFGIADSDLYEYSFDLRPIYKVSDINGQPSVYFDPDLYAYMTLPSAIKLGSENTIMVAWQPEQPTEESQYIMMVSDGGLSMLSATDDENPITIAFFAGGGWNFDYTYNEPFIFSLLRANGTNRMYDIYNELSPTGTYTNGGNTEFYGISSLTYLRKLHGHMSELLLYDRALLQTHFTQLTDYLNYKRLLGADVTTGVSNTVTATTTTSEFSTTNNTSNSIISYTGTADIELTSKSINRGVVYRDQQLVYTLTATNIGDAIATGVQMIDVLASGLVYNTSTVYTTASGYISVIPNQESIVTGTRLTRSGFALGVGETATVVFTATMQDSIAGGTGNYSGYALTFDQDTDYVSIGHHDALAFDVTDSFSVSAWVKTPEVSNHEYIVSKEYFDGQIGYSFYIDQFTDSLDVVLAANGNTKIRVRADDNWQIDDDRWHHVAFTYNGNLDETGVVMYIDGQIVTDRIVVSNDVESDNSMDYFGSLSIGIREHDGYGDFGGEIYDVRIFNATKTQQEIKDIMRGYADPNNLVGRWRFDEGTGDILYDSSGNGFHGTRSGDVSFVTHTGNSFRDAIGGQLSGSTYIPLDMSNPQYDVLGNTITNTYNITNIAQVVLGSYEYITTNNTNSAFVQPVVANDVHISLSATGTYQFSENVVFTLLYSGSGPDTVTGTITLALVDALSGTAVSMPGYSFSDNIYTRSMSIGSGTMGSIVLTAQVVSSTGNVGGINTGIITHDYYLADDSDDIDISSTVLNYGTDIAISQRMHSGDVRSGDLVNLIIEYENLGPYTGTNLTIISSISPSISLLSSIPTRDDYPTIDLTTAGGHGDYAILDTFIQINEAGVVNRLEALIHDYADSSNGTLFGHTGSDNYFQGLNNDSVAVRFGTDLFTQTVSGLDLSAIGDFYLEIELYNDGVNPLNIQRWIRSASDYDTILATNSGTLANYNTSNLINLFTSYQGSPQRLLDAKVDYVKIYEDDVLEHYRIWLGEGNKIFDVVGGNHATIVSDDLAALAGTQDTYSHQVLYGRSVQQTGGSNVDVPNTITGGTLSLPGYTVTQTYPVNTYIWTIGSVGSGDNDIIVAEGQMTTGTVDVPVYAHTTGSISEYDENTGNDSASTISTGNSWYDLSITKSADVGTASLYDYITYTITYINSGVTTGTDVTLTDTLASGLWYQSSRIDTGAGYVRGSPVITGNASGETIVTRSLDNVGLNASGTIVLTAYVANVFIDDLDFHLGRAYYFDGVDDYVLATNIDTSTFGTSGSISAYVSFTGTSSSNERVFEIGAGANGKRIGLYRRDTQDLYVHAVADSGAVSSTVGFYPSTGQIYFIELFWGPDGIVVNIDGVTELEEVANAALTMGATKNFVLGAFIDIVTDNNYRHRGMIFDVKLNDGSGNNILHWLASEGTGNIAVDASRNGNDGVLYSGVAHVTHTGIEYQDVYGYSQNHILGNASADQMHVGYNSLWILDVPIFDNTINDAGYMYQTDSGTPIDATTSIDLERTSSTPAVIARNLSTNHRNWLDTYADTRLVRYTVDMAGYGDVDRTQLEVSAVSGTSQVVYGGGRTTVSVLVQRDKNAAAGRGVNIRAYKSAGGIGRGLKIYNIKVEILSGYIPRDEYNPGYDVYGNVLDYRPSIFNYFTATGAGYDTVANDKKSARTQYVNQPDLRISKTANVDSVYRNQYITYTITFDNIGDTTGTDLVVTDTLLSGVQYVLSSLTGDVSSYNFGTATNASGHTILSRTGMTLGVGQTGTIVLTAQVISPLVAAGYGPIQPGRAYQFNGLGSYIRVPHSSGYDITNGEFTFTTRVKLSAHQTQYLIRKASSTQGLLAYLLSDGKIYVGAGNSTQSTSLIDSNTSLSLGAWYHVAIVISNDFIKIYINGILDRVYYHQVTATSATGNDLQLFEDGGSVRSLSGQAYDVRLYNRALNAGDIRAIYNYDTSITPSLWLRLDEGFGIGGYAYDTAGGEHHGTLDNTVPVITYQHSYHNEFGYSIYGRYHRNANRINLTDLDHSLTTFSAFAWIRSDELNTFKTVFSHNDGPLDECGFWLFSSNSNKLAINLYGDTTCNDRKNYSTDDDIIDGTRHHVGFTWNNGILKLYIDGEEASVSKNYDDSFTAMDDSDAEVRIGSVSDNGGYDHSFQQGTIKDVGMRNKTLSDAEVQALYASGAIPIDDILGFWPINDGTGTTIHDVSRQQNHGTLEGQTSDEFWMFIPRDETNPTHDIFNYPLMYPHAGIANTTDISSGSDYDEINNTYTQRIAYVGSPDLTITKQVYDLAVAYYNKQVGYTITVTNSGDAIATGVTVTDVLPSGMQYVSYTTNQIANESFGTGMSGSLQTVTRSGFALAPNTSGTIVMTAVVLSNPSVALSGRAYSFDGNNDNITISNIGNKYGITLAAWVRLASGSNATQVITNGGGAVDDQGFSNGKMKMRVDGSTFTAGPDLRDGQRHHCVRQFDNVSGDKTYRLYVDGTLVGTTGGSSNVIGFFYQISKTSAPIDGDVHSVYLYASTNGGDAVPTASEIADMYDNDQYITRGLLSVWQMNEGVGSVAYDSYGNNNGTIDGAVHITHTGTSLASVYGYTTSGSLYVPADLNNPGYDIFGRRIPRSKVYYNYVDIGVPASYEYDTTNNKASVMSTYPYTDAVDLSISMTATGAYVSGGLIRYTITYTNNGMATTDVSVTSTLSNTLSGVSATTGRDNYTGGIYTWENIDLTAGETGSIVFTAQAVSGWTYAALVNTATIIAGNFIDLATGNNTAIASNRLYQGQPIAVIVDQSADVNTAVYNDIVTYTISFYASGATGDLSDVSLYTYMTTGLTYISHVLTGVTGYNFSMGNTAGGSQYLHRTGDWLYAGETGIITLTTRVTQFNEPAIYHESRAYQFDGQNDTILATITGTDYLSSPNKTYVIDLYHTTQLGNGFISLLQDNITNSNNISSKINGLQYDGSNKDKIWLSVGNGTSFGGTNADYIFPADGRYRVVGVVKGNDYAKLYVNGVEVGANDSLSISPVSYGNIYIGKGQSYFSGMMYNIQIWNAARDSGDVLYHYNTNNLPTNRSGTDLSVSDMELWYQGNEGTGNVAIDASRNGNDGTLAGISHVTINTGWNAYNLFGYNTSGSLYYPLDASRPYFDIFGEPLRYLYGYIPVVSTVTASTATGALPMTESGTSVAFNDIYDVYTVTVQPAFRQNSTYEMTGDFRVMQYTGGARSGVYNSVKTTGDTQISIGDSGTGTVALPNNVFVSGDMYMVVFKGLGALSVGYTGTRTDDLTGFDFTDASNPYIYPSFVYNGTNLLKMGDVDVSTIGTYDLVVGGDYQVINSALSRGSSIATGNAHYDLDNNGFVTSIEQATVIQFLDDDGYIGRLDLNDIILKTGFVSF